MSSSPVVDDHETGRELVVADRNVLSAIWFFGDVAGVADRYPDRICPRNVFFQAEEPWIGMHQQHVETGVQGPQYASAVVAGLYYVAQGKYVNAVMFGALVLGTGLFLGSLLVIRRGWQMARPR